MQGYSGALWCIAWIVGLLTTQSPWWITAIGALAFPSIGITARKLRPASHQVQPWLIASVIVLMALGWYHFRTPQPGAFDISRFVEPIDRTTIQITGTVDELPRTTRSGKTKLWLTVQSLDAGDLNSRLTIAPDKANGKLYVTIRDRHPSFAPGTQVQFKGKLYSPKSAQNPGGFDFKKRLAIEGCFAGLAADEFTIIAPPKQTWGLWQLQQRIVQAQMVGLPGEEGLLLAAMVLGNRAVDLPSDMQDAFTKIGMSHALAASGFQVSLTLSVVLALCSRASKQVKGIAGGIAIVILIGLAGAQPAILRAGVMGAAVLVAIVAEKKVKPIGSLLFASVLLLVWNPLWIWDLGFQLSALATLGLLVTSEPLQNHLDWLPSPIAAAFATPIAAYIWVLPLQLYAFGLVSPYSIPANVLTTVLISIISRPPAKVS
jgi:competence protein ComEC